ncbi:predicted protein [Histoplasma mississippiense (nom. inval.)]|uniref:predicted protein n=1 Tax=Ajellomyces capsulatus (strain NAm1 / WU24) TaxID=2059318 RepID=UPI000157B48B|nr:predicted protein [Histoplasma mississippiense (nom. inval.)]EDN02559.1 predicted protein [Histoplasma mississippiense (nom. inval.)]
MKKTKGGQANVKEERNCVRKDWGLSSQNPPGITQSSHVTYLNNQTQTIGIPKVQNKRRGSWVRYCGLGKPTGVASNRKEYKRLQGAVARRGTIPGRSWFGEEGGSNQARRGMGGEKMEEPEERRWPRRGGERTRRMVAGVAETGQDMDRDVVGVVDAAGRSAVVVVVGCGCGCRCGCGCGCGCRRRRLSGGKVE